MKYGMSVSMSRKVAKRKTLLVVSLWRWMFHSYKLANELPNVRTGPLLTHNTRAERHQLKVADGVTEEGTHLPVVGHRSVTRLSKVCCATLETFVPL